MRTRDGRGNGMNYDRYNLFGKKPRSEFQAAVETQLDEQIVLSNKREG